MTLEEIFREDDEAPPPPTLPDITVELTEAELVNAGIPLDESRWSPSKVKGIYQRVDPGRPEMKQRRHVHLSQKKHLTSAGQQVSWNDDGTRHDRHSFNNKFGQRTDVRDVARVVFGLPDDVLLEHKTRVSSVMGELAKSTLEESVEGVLYNPGSVSLTSRAAAIM